MTKQLTPPTFILAPPTRVRYGVLLFACSLAMITYLDRVCLGAVAPTIQQELGLSDGQKGMMFSAFALAYALFEVPSGWLGDVFGPRKTLIRIVLWWSLFTALTGSIYSSVFGTTGAFVLFIIVQFLFGMGEAGAFPNIARSFHNWFPTSERGFAQGMVWMSGRFAGGATPLVVTALIWKVTELEGQTVVHWRHVFWLFGILGVVWVFFFWRWFKDRPEEKEGVNEAELMLIRGKITTPAVNTDRGPLLETNIKLKELPISSITGEDSVTLKGPAEFESRQANESSKPARPIESSHANVPWGKLLSSPSLWALCFLYFCTSYGWYFNITYLPGFLQKQMKVTPEEYGRVTFGLMAGAPLLLGSLACLVGGLLTDAMIRRTGDLRWGRRLFGVIGHSVCACCYFMAIFAISAGNAWWFVASVALAAFWNDITMGATWATCLDIGKQYSGIVSGCMNTIGNLGGATAGAITGFIASQRFPSANDGWTINFTIYGSVYLVAVVLWFFVDASKPIVPDIEPLAPEEEPCIG
jgi:MFS family permease